MNQKFSAFLDRLAERFTAIIAGVISSRVEGLRAVTQAEQQSQLEDLARKYEADGKLAIAQTLRQRALGLTDTNLAGEGVDVIEAVAGEPLKLTGPDQSLHGAHENLPDFSKSSKSRKKSTTRDTDAAGPGIDGATL